MIRTLSAEWYFLSPPPITLCYVETYQFAWITFISWQFWIKILKLWNPQIWTQCGSKPYFHNSMIKKMRTYPLNKSTFRVESKPIHTKNCNLAQKMLKTFPQNIVWLNLETNITCVYRMKTRYFNKHRKI